MSDMKCPFCKEELSYAQEIDGGFEILTCDCPHGIWLFGNDKMWHNLEKVITELECTRKALDIAKDAIDVISLKYHKDTPSIFLIKYAQNAKDQITALEQKD